MASTWTRPWVYGLALLGVTACGAPQRGDARPASAVESSAPSAAPIAEPEREATPSPVSQNAAPCGAFECRYFDDSIAAFEQVLGDEPLVLGLGEAHVLAAAGAVRSTARRFSEELLPAFAPRASHLIVEILNPNPSCEAATREVRRQHEPVTREQSPDNQNDYVALGHQARKLGVEPFLLSPTCEEYALIASAGADAIERTLSTIATVTARMTLGAVNQNRKAGRERFVIAYGGAMHNDIAPDAARASFSYGPRVLAATGGRYTELDLIVRELIKDTEAWRALPWFGHFDPAQHPERTVLMRVAPRSYVLFFPAAAAGAPPEP